MNKSAILHIPLSQYAFAEDEHTIRIRLRTQRDDMKHCELYYGDRVCPVNPIKLTKLEMQKIATDDLFDYYETVIQDIYTRVCYYFLLDDGEEKQYYYERNFCTEIGDNRTEYFQFPYIRREDIIDIPDWAEDVVMYHIFPDSFANAKRKLVDGKKEVLLGDGIKSVTNHGGTLEGIKENVDYLADLGINCIYLNPIFLANSYHKYDTIDYFKIDSCFGTEQDLLDLVQECHKHGLRVILDGVFNHCGPDFFAFRDVLKNGENSRYYDWFYSMPKKVVYQDPPTYEAFAYVKEMPKLNTGNKEVADYILKVATYWIEKTGIDGWRLDVANEINHDLWREFRKRVREIKPDFFLIGEIWEDAGCWLLGDQFDSTMNYRFTYLCRDFFGQRTLSVHEFDEQMQKMIMRYPKRVSLAQMNMLDSHDVPRFLSFCDGDEKRMELAFFYLFMAVGIPSVFYGDEMYLRGVEEPEYRQVMPWESTHTCKEKMKQWIAFRREHEAIRKGDYRTVYVDDEKGIYGFNRECDKEKIVVYVNNSDTIVNLSLPEGNYVDAFTKQTVSGCVQLSALTGTCLVRNRL